MTLETLPQSLIDFRSEYIERNTENLYNICLDIKERYNKAIEGIHPSDKRYTYAISDFMAQLRKEGNQSLYYEFIFARTVRKEPIHEYVIKRSDELITNLINRTQVKVGTITDTSLLHLTSDNQGNTILAGYIEGTEGKALIKSVIAGGYNIQKLHVRVTIR